MAEHEFTPTGEVVWLEFVNSARAREPRPRDLIPDADAFARWARVHHLDAGAGVDLDTVRRFRERLTELADALHERRQPPAGAVAAINERLSRSPGCQQLTRVNGAWELRFAARGGAPALEAIARSAAATLANPGVTVRRCGGDGCSLFFADGSLAQSRCSCGPDCAGQVRVERRRRRLLR